MALESALFAPPRPLRARSAAPASFRCLLPAGTATATVSPAVAVAPFPLAEELRFLAAQARERRRRWICAEPGHASLAGLARYVEDLAAILRAIGGPGLIDRIRAALDGLPDAEMLDHGGPSARIRLFITGMEALAGILEAREAAPHA